MSLLRPAGATVCWPHAAPASGRRAPRLRARLTALPSDLVLLVLAETATSPRVGYGKGLGHGEAAG